MFWLFNINRFLYLQEKDIWIQVCILYKTDRAILVNNDMKIWIAKLRIKKIRLKNNVFEIYVKESMVG